MFKRRIYEIQCKCLQCGKVWHYLPSEARQLGKKCSNLNKNCVGATACCGNPLGVIVGTRPNQEVKDYDKCPECGSKNVSKKKIYYKNEKE